MSNFDHQRHRGAGGRFTRLEGDPSDVELTLPGAPAVVVANLGRLTDAGRSTWEAITELVDRVPAAKWAVVGGQMVAIHAAVAGVDAPRVTDDGDVVVDVRVFGRQAVIDVAKALTSADFRTFESPEGVTRFERGRAKIDLLAPEGMGAANVETVPPGYAIQAPGATQALERTIEVTVSWGDDEVTVRCPSLLGAIIAKAAGSKEIVSLTNDERLKHQQDLVFLLSLAAFGSGSGLDGMRAEMSKRDRKRLRSAITPILEDRTHRARRAAANFEDAADAASVLLG